MYLTQAKAQAEAKRKQEQEAAKQKAAAEAQVSTPYTTSHYWHTHTHKTGPTLNPYRLTHTLSYCNTRKTCTINTHSTHTVRQCVHVCS